MRQLNVCPICASGEVSELYRFEIGACIPGRVVRCASCKTVYKIPSDMTRPLSAYYDETYAGQSYWEQETAALPTFSRILNIISRRAVAGARLLDIGSGPGTFLTLAQDEGGFKVSGVELNPTLAARARASSKAEVVLGDFMAAELNGRQFGVITMLDLIEHLQDPVAALKRCGSLLESGGFLALYTPNHNGLIVRTAGWLYRLTRGAFRRPVVEIFDCTHVVYFDQLSLKAAVSQAGLEVVETVLMKYEPSRSQQARGIEDFCLRLVESVAALFKAQFRILMIAQKP